MGFLKNIQGKGFFMILSDHGFAPIKKEVNINKFLEKQGFLILKNEGDLYERIDHQTKAFNLDPCRIYIHDKDLYPRGKVRREERVGLLRRSRRL